jgi:Right handed beta helix region
MMFSPRLSHLATAVLSIWLTALSALADIRVASPEDLDLALQSTNGGIVVLAPGHYGTLEIVALAPESPLVLRSENPADPAIFRAIEIRRSANITLQNLKIEGTIAISGESHDIGYPEGLGLMIRASHDIAIDDCEITRFKIGLHTRDVQNLTVTGNDFHNLRMDGMQFVEVRNVTISDNFIHSFTRAEDAPDHPDMIQFWTTGAKSASVNILIENNTLDAEQGTWTQSIFMRNERADQGEGGPEIWYQNVIIRGNVIRNAHRHGITVGETIGLIIADNQVLWQREAIQPGQDRDLQLPAISVSERAKDVTISGNIFWTIAGFRRQPDWLVTDNRSARNLSQ